MCNATGNPTPNYFWTFSDDDIITNSTLPTIQIFDPGYYECNATNIVRGVKHSNTSGINVSVCKYLTCSSTFAL